MSFLDIAKTVSSVQGTIGAAKNVVQSIESLFGVDVVGLYDNTSFDQIFATARPMRASINRQSKLMDHPQESGALITDFSILLPVEIELSMMLNSDDYAAVYQVFKSYYTTRTLMIVQTRADTFSNMLIQGIPNDESPDTIDALPLTLKMREVQIITVQYQALTASAVATPTDQSTVSTGVQTPKDSLLYSATTAISK